MTRRPTGLRGAIVAASVLVGLAVAFTASGAGNQKTARAATPTDHYVAAPPEAGTDIPAATVRFGMRPYADNTFYVVAMKKGWFKDVGITIAPQPYGLKVTDAVVT